MDKGTFDLKIGFKCNNNCKHCVVADKRDSGNLDLETLYEIIESIPDGYIVQVTGGEPSMFSYLPDILKKCKDLGHKVVIQTNGTGFADLEFAEKCIPYIDHAHVAIHSCYSSIHDEIVGSEGMWLKTIEGFKNLLNSNVVVTTQTVLSKYNIEYLYDTFEFIQSLAPRTVMSMTYPHMMGNAWNNREEVIFRYSDHKEVISRTLKDFGDYIFTEAIPPCYLYPYQDVVESAEKDILNSIECNRTSRVGVDFSGSLDNRNYNDLDLGSHRKGPLCRECVFNSKCIGVWQEYIEVFKNKLDLIPVKECCNNEG